jgi:hypothetical protein
MFYRYSMASRPVPTRTSTILRTSSSGNKASVLATTGELDMQLARVYQRRFST